MGSCEATLEVTVGQPGPISKAMLVCDLPEGHPSLHHDAQDHVWWREDETGHAVNQVTGLDTE